tara:strand:- start:25952 stop:26620 length:669 start_codon:yes stop_codon:yes gene_type:complete
MNAVKGVSVDITITGCVDEYKKLKNVKVNEACSDANSGMLSKLRFIAADKVDGDIIVFVDDDFIFPDNWLFNLINYSKKKYWNILGNKILLPNGDRFWDRCIFKPHTMVDYNHPKDDPFLYQTGGFWVITKSAYSLLKWDPSIPINADRKGMNYNEDIDMSIRARKLGFNISFDKDNLVWHNDESYFQSGYVVLKRQINNMIPYGYARDFLSTLLKLNSGKK